jgi:hypothetical protein
MVEERKRTISEMVEDTELMTAAIRQGIREELLLQARAGISVPVSKDGTVVWWSPDDVFRELGYVPPAHSKAS